MNNEKKFIDVSTLDINDEELMKKISSTLNDIYYDGNKCLQRYNEELDTHLKTATAAVERSNVEKIEKRKTLLSKILYIVGSVLHPETMPVEMYDEQKMPEKNRKAFDTYHKKALEYQTSISETLDLMEDFRTKYDNMWKKGLSTSENKIEILGKMIHLYQICTTTKENVNTDIIYKLMTNYGYITKDDYAPYACHGIVLTKTTISDKIDTLTNWYFNEYSNKKTR